LFEQLIGLRRDARRQVSLIGAFGESSVTLRDFMGVCAVTRFFTMSLLTRLTRSFVMPSHCRNVSAGAFLGAGLAAQYITSLLIGHASALS
jgi:hypothetical protein